MCKLTRGERFKDARTVHNKNGSQSMDEVYSATGVSASMIKDLEDDDKNRSVGYDKIAVLAKHYGVSSDYLLGLSENPTTNKDLDAVCKFTGLSQKSVQCLRDGQQWGIGSDLVRVIDTLLLDSMYHNIDKRNQRTYRPILNLLDYFFRYSNLGMKKQIFTNGYITDADTDGFISSNAIALNDVIIENAVLSEIQLALISLKRNQNNPEDK